MWCVLAKLIRLSDKGWKQTLKVIKQKRRMKTADKKRVFKFFFNRKEAKQVWPGNRLHQTAEMSDKNKILQRKKIIQKLLFAFYYSSFSPAHICVLSEKQTLHAYSAFASRPFLENNTSPESYYFLCFWFIFKHIKTAKIMNSWFLKNR